MANEKKWNPDAEWMRKLEAALLAALAILLLWKGILPAWKELNTDFPNYYLVARLWREGYALDRIYDWIWLQRIKDHWGLSQPLVGFAGLTPLSALPVAPLTFFSALAAKRIWIVINLGMLAACVELLHRSTSLGRRRIWLLALLAIIPLRTSFLYGQMHLAVLFLMVLAYYFHQRRRELACGVCIALAGALKVYPLAFILYFLWKRQWRAATATAGVFLGVLTAGTIAMGWEVQRIYLLQMLPRSLQGEVLDPYSPNAAAGAAFLHRLFLFEPVLNPSPAFASTMLYTVMYPLWQLTVLLPLFAVLYLRGDDSRKQVEWGAFLFALLLLSPVPSTYHFVVVILCVVLFVDALVRERRWAMALGATALYFLVSIVDFIPHFFHYHSVLSVLALPRLWFGTALFILFLIYLYRSRPAQPEHDRKIHAVMLAAFAVLVMTTGFVSYRHHLFHREQEMSLHISPAVTDLLATLPQPDPRGYTFVGMSRTGYYISSEDNKNSLKTRSSLDELSFAVSPDHALYVEVADLSGSRIVRKSDGAVIARNAESPAISQDGRQLAFLRERKGHGSLWLTPLADAEQPVPPLRLTEDSYDVRSVSFLRSDLLLFLARHDGQTGIFTVKPGGSPEPFFSTGKEIASFAVSPEQRIAFTELVHNRWQLAVWEPSSRTESMLTSNDCNAYTPAWTSQSAIVYGTDCDRGVGLTALASMSVPLQATSIQ